MQQIDGTPLTLAEAISWIAWRIAIPRTIFDLAFRDNDPVLPATADARATLKAAARGNAFGTDAFERDLAAAELALFGALASGRLTCRGKADERDQSWHTVEADWFTDDGIDERKLIALLDRDWIDRNGPTPLDHIFGPYARPNPNGWQSVRFRRDEVIALWPAAPAATAVSQADSQQAFTPRQRSGLDRAAAWMVSHTSEAGPLKKREPSLEQCRRETACTYREALEAWNNLPSDRKRKPRQTDQILIGG